MRVSTGPRRQIREYQCPERGCRCWQLAETRPDCPDHHIPMRKVKE